LTLAAALALGAAPAGAAATAAGVRAEIDALLARLQASDCQFGRNGTWYAGTEAKDHLLRKLSAIEGRTTVASTEQFIELAASRSSTTGRPYAVRCAAQAATPSQQWLTQQLTVLRAAKPGAAPR